MPGKSRDPEGRMPLAEHFRELRRRVIISVVAIGLATVAGWYLYEPAWQKLQEPMLEIAAERGVDAQVNFQSLTSAFNLHIKLAVYLAIVIASPVWLYQIWAFVTPGLTRKERRTSIAFVSSAVPLFLTGIALAWFVLPHAVKVADIGRVATARDVTASEALDVLRVVARAVGRTVDDLAGDVVAGRVDPACLRPDGLPPTPRR